MTGHNAHIATRRHYTGRLALAAGLLLMTSGLIGGCAMPQPAQAPATTPQQEPGTIKLHMGGQVRFYGTVSSRPH